MFNFWDLDCSFERRAVDCMWANHEQAEPAWQIGTTPLDKHKFISLTGSSEFPGKVLFIRKHLCNYC